jgi:hypothetical protein
MAVIIGAGTKVVGAAGVVSVSWETSPNIERLWELGSFSPYATRKQFTQTVNLTVYAGALDPPITVYPPASSCEDSEALLDINIIPATCDASVESIDGPFFLTSYGYSKGGPTEYGQETYAGQIWLDHPTFPEPTYVLLGITEGQYSGTLTMAEMGIEVAQVQDPEDQGQSGSVSAGFPGLGEADITYYIFGVLRVGGGVLGDSESTGSGRYGTASVTVPHTPVWVA